jgi:uncharacterized protein (TIGR02145 family)
MKRFPSLVIMLLLLINSVRPQTIAITFQGTLNGTPTPLDSILVMNLTQGGDTTILFPGNTLLLVGATGAGDLTTADAAMQGMPNPFAYSTEVTVPAKAGKLQIALQDALGREIAVHVADVAAGDHRFRVACARPGVHLLTAVQGGERRTLRLVCTEAAGGAGLTTLGRTDRGMPKDDRSLFSWMPGDELRYIGYATVSGFVQSAVIEEVPEATATRTFQLAPGAVCPGSPFVVDIDGNVYRAVQIGGQCWTAENLRTDRYANGDTIPVLNGAEWTTVNSGGWVYYFSNPIYEPIYGRLYNWFAVADPRNLCPTGWHVPTDEEWQTLELLQGMPISQLNATEFRGEAQNVGGKLKLAGNEFWYGPNTGANNATGFSALPGGGRTSTGAYQNLQEYGSWWTSTSTEFAAWSRSMGRYGAGISRDVFERRRGFSVRCIRD